MKQGLSAEGSGQKGKEQEGGKETFKPTLPEALAAILAALNLVIAATPQFEVYYMAPIGILGASSIVVQHRKPFFGWLLSLGAAILSLSVGIVAVSTSVVIYPFLGKDPLLFFEVNLVHLIYLALSIATFFVLIKQRPIS
jgi:hypothetical protein